MSKVKVGAFSVSLDGFGAGPRQDRENPRGVRGFELHAWFQKTAVFQKMHDLGDGSQGAPLPMKGGTTFHFVTDGPESALQQAKNEANGQDVRIGGGVSTIRQYLTAGQVDEMHLAFSPVLLGEGENLFAGIDLPKLGFRPVDTRAGEEATHVILKRT
jgi:hypothetical protein